jgi:TPR repeat protein
MVKLSLDAESAMPKRSGVFALAVAAFLATALLPAGQSDAAETSTPASERAACDKGDADACSTPASRYSDGDGVPKDQAGELKFRTRACDLGDGSECVLAAYSVMEGEGTKKDGAAQT